MIGFVFLIAGLFCAATLGIFHKYADIKKCRPSAINVSLFLSASVIIWSYILFYKILGCHEDLFPPFTMKATLVAVACGICCSFGILTFQIGVRYGRIATSWLIVNLSTLVPAALSLIIYHEWQDKLKIQQIAALLFVLLSVFLLWRDKEIELAKTQKRSEQEKGKS